MKRKRIAITNEDIQWLRTRACEELRAMGNTKILIKKKEHYQLYQQYEALWKANLERLK